MILEGILKHIKNADNILISAHTNPDGDAIGAMVAMGCFCESLNIPYSILLEESLSDFDFLLNQVITTNKVANKVDLFISLDCGNRERLVGYEDYFMHAAKTLVIDHHISNDYYGETNYVVPDASSTSELVYELVRSSGITMSKTMAEALYVGMLTDTGGFMHSCTGASTLRACAFLLEQNIDFTAIYYKLIHEKSLKTVKLQSLAVGHLEKINEGIFMSYLSREDLVSVGASKKDVDSIVSFLKNIQGTKVIGFVYPIDGKDCYKLSTRGDEPYNMTLFCKHFGGGGHERASGATLEMSLEESMRAVSEQLKRL